MTLHRDLLQVVPYTRAVIGEFRRLSRKTNQGISVVLRELKIDMVVVNIRFNY
jgi:hypothetical protein